MKRFVIQEHHASRLHWDLRLEMDGVLKSWAVPKQPVMDPKVKRLAIEVADHDLEDIDFEGEIAEGSYGAGTVTIWDAGTYELLERKEDRIKVTLNGKKLSGTFNFIKTGYGGKKNNWIFFKSSKDDRK